MARLVDLPVEILDQIVGLISPSEKATLAGLCLSCRSLYNHITPTLYQTLEIRFKGSNSWDSIIDSLRNLAPPGSYEIPAYAVEPEELTDRKGKRVDGRTSAESASSDPPAVCGPRKFAVTCIREIMVTGELLAPHEHHHHTMVPTEGILDKFHNSFVKVLQGLLWSLDKLDRFQWEVFMPLPPKISAAVSRFDSLTTLEMNADSHIMCNTLYAEPGMRQPLNAIDPLPFYHNSLVTLRVSKIGDFNQIILFGDVIRSPTNWKSLRILDIDLAPGFVSALADMESLEPDILFTLFRPPAPQRGALIFPKMELHEIKFREVVFQSTGVKALCSCIDAAELRCLDLACCQDGSVLLRRWEKNVMKKLEKFAVKEDISLPVICKFLKQFGPDGTCRNLKTVEVLCWHVDRFTMFDHGYPDLMFNDHHHNYDDNDSETWDSEEDEEDEEDEDGDYLDYPIGPLGPTSVAYYAGLSNASRNNATPSRANPIPMPWRSVADLKGSREERWGLERLMIEIRPGFGPQAVNQLPRQDIFFEGFWNLRELALPVSYGEDWEPFVETIANLPALEYLHLLNARPEPRSPSSAYATFTDYDSHFVIPSLPRLNQNLNSRTNKRKQKEREKQPDREYIDALSIAVKNRLFVHSNGFSNDSGAGSSSSAASQDTWRGKLKYISVRIHTVMTPRTSTKVWKVHVRPAPPKVKHVIPEGDRRRSLRSSTKRRKIEQDKTNWREVEEGDQICSLIEVPVSLHAGLANGLFVGFDKSHRAY